MKKRKWRRMLRAKKFTLHQAVKEPMTFSVRWCKEGANYGERIFQAPNEEQAIAMAPVVADLVAPPETEAQSSVSLADAFGAALSASKRGERAKQDWHRGVRRFAEWLVMNHREVGAWHQVTRVIVREYLESMDGLSPNSKRLAIQPIQQTDNWMSREYGFRPVAQGLGIGNATVKPPAKVYISDLVEFLDFLCESAPHLELGAALQGLAGLRLLEVYRLTRGCLDLKHGLVEISGDVKNEWSRRVIPLCNRVLAAAKRRPVAAPRANGKAGTRAQMPVVAGYRHWEHYSRALAREMKRWNPEVSWSPKDLRNAIPTWAASVGRQGSLIEQYIGHAPKDVTSRHYVPRIGSVSRGEEEELKKAMALFRDQVVEPLNAVIEGRGVPLFSTQAPTNGG